MGIPNAEFGRPELAQDISTLPDLVSNSAHDQPSLANSSYYTAGNYATDGATYGNILFNVQDLVLHDSPWPLDFTSAPTMDLGIQEIRDTFLLGVSRSKLLRGRIRALRVGILCGIFGYDARVC